MPRPPDLKPSTPQSPGIPNDPASGGMPEPLEPLPKSIDLRPWIALLVVAAGVALAVRQWPWMRWLVVVMLALALLRAMGFVLAANALGKDPEKVKENPSEASRKADRPA